MNLWAVNAAGGMLDQTVKIFKGRIQLSLEGNNMQGSLLFRENPLEFIADIGVFQDPPIGRFGLFFVDPVGLLPHLHFVDALEIRVKKVIQRVHHPVDRGEGGPGFIPLETPVADGFTHDITVFLLYEGVVVFVILAASGEINLVGFAPAFKMPVDKLRAIIAVDSLERHGEGGTDVLKLLQGPLPGLVFKGAEL